MTKKVVSDLMCALNFHNWILTFVNGPRKERTCTHCKKLQSTMYDMSYGDTYWVSGKCWSNTHENFIDIL